MTPEEAQRAERDARLPYVYPVKFETRYREKNGQHIPEDWVEYAKKGTQNAQITPARWRDVERRPDLLAVLKPSYENWKKGQADPVSGTPLDAWMADAGLVKILNNVGIRSVEDFAQLEDHIMVKLNIQGVREKQKRAKSFLEAQASTAKVSEEIAKVKTENEDLRRELTEMRALIEQHAIKKQEEAVQVKRGPGRPRKVEAA